MEPKKFIHEESVQGGFPNNTCVCYQLALPGLNLVSLFDAISSLPKMYLKMKDRDEEICAWGSIAEIQKTSELEKIKWPSSLESRWYGGLSFDSEGNEEPLWQGFDSCRFFLPEFEVRRVGDEKWFSWNVAKAGAADKDSVINDMRHQLGNILVENYETIAPLTYSIDQREDVTREDWQHNVEQALAIINAEQLKKVVFARTIRHRFGEDVKPAQFLKSFHRMKSPAYFFAIAFPGSATFLGSSPELLFRRNSDQIEAEAIAGTERRGVSSEEDLRLSAALFNSKKNRLEQNLVHQYLVNELHPFCLGMKSTAVELLKLIKVQHLKSKIVGQLKAHVSDVDLLTVLHPTPSVCGLPKEKAMHLIRETEPFSRGWYAGALGFLGSGSSEFFVGLRSGVLSGREFHMFAGAGIVEGSVPSLEWEEIENKFRNYTDVLRGK